MTAIYQKELKSYFNNLFGYLYIAIVLLFMGIYASIFHFNYMATDVGYTLNQSAIAVVLVTPLLTMRIIAGERQRKTDQLLYSLPISVSATVIGKYLAMLTVFAVPMGVVCLYPLVFSMFGTVNFALSYGSIFAYFLMGASLLAIGMFISALTENQIVSAIISFLAMLVVYFSSMFISYLPADATTAFVVLALFGVLLGIIVFAMVKNYLFALIVTTICEVGISVLYIFKRSFFEGLLGEFVGGISVYERCLNFYEGMFDLTAIVYFLSVISLFVFLTVQAVEKRRWS
ncbi:MAG: ABC transporter permease subunit [Clostridia bacterium]|nr:ABC transporter permease subunit [Clostridia bacterium]